MAKINQNAAPTETPDKDRFSTLNLGPTHPATHGIFQNVLKMDGEIILDAEPYHWLYTSCL